MKKIEFNPDGQMTTVSKHGDFVDPAIANDLFLELLPVLFHKLKNKLTPILGYAQILQARITDEFTLERLQKIAGNASELNDLLTILKEYFKVQPGAKVRGNLNQIVRGLAPHWREIEAREKVSLSLDLDANVADMPVLPGQIELLLLNLTDNSLAALQTVMDRRKEIRLTTRSETGLVKLVVHDNGIGMSETEINNIWAPFHSTYPKCAGLGLMLCEKIIANHGGVCQVKSQPEKFSEFAIAFTLTEKLPPEQKTIHKHAAANKK